MDRSFGQLEHVVPATVWQSEPGEFVPWLTEEENLRRLGLALRFDLEPLARETHVGRFRADLLCRDRPTGEAVVIEAQLGLSDHSHLGQVLTYALRLPACAVWLATRFHEEHREVVRDLNRLGDGALRCFAVEMRLWQIAGSPLAPDFTLVAGPDVPAAPADEAVAERISGAGAALLLPHAISRPASDESPIRACRRRRGMTIRELADAAGISHAYLSHIETGRHRGAPKTRSAIAKALDLPPDALS